MSYAPILIITLNRDKHLIKCVESLKKCTHSKESDLFIFLDYPSKPEQWGGYNKIKNYLNTLSGFREINIIEREENYGAYKNYILAEEKILSLYDRFIYTEDDNEFSENFLDYLNKGLDKFHDDESIAAICSLGGLMNIPKDYQSNYLYARGFCGWGFATWKNKLMKEKYSLNELCYIWKDKKLRQKIWNNSKVLYFDIIKSIYNKNELLEDSAICLYLLLSNKYCIYPTTSKVRNYGHDRSGIHGGYVENSIYTQLELDKGPYFEYSESAPTDDKYITREVIAAYNYPFLTNLKLFTRNFILKHIKKYSNKHNG